MSHSHFALVPYLTINQPKVIVRWHFISVFLLLPFPTTASKNGVEKVRSRFPLRLISFYFIASQSLKRYTFITFGLSSHCVIMFLCYFDAESQTDASLRRSESELGVNKRN